MRKLVDNFAEKGHGIDSNLYPLLKAIVLIVTIAKMNG